MTSISLLLELLASKADFLSSLLGLGGRLTGTVKHFWCARGATIQPLDRTATEPSIRPCSKGSHRISDQTLYRPSTVPSRVGLRAHHTDLSGCASMAWNPPPRCSASSARHPPPKANTNVRETGKSSPCKRPIVWSGRLVTMVQIRSTSAVGATRCYPC